MPNVHSTRPKAVRLPDGLEVRMKEAAETAGETVNAFIVAAIEERLERRSGGSTARPAAPARVAPPRRPRKPRTDNAPPVKLREPESASDIVAGIFRRRNGED